MVLQISTIFKLVFPLFSATAFLCACTIVMCGQISPGFLDLVQASLTAGSAVLFCWFSGLSSSWSIELKAESATEGRRVGGFLWKMPLKTLINSCSSMPYWQFFLLGLNGEVVACKYLPWVRKFWHSPQKRSWPVTHIHGLAELWAGAELLQNPKLPKAGQPRSSAASIAKGCSAEAWPRCCSDNVFASNHLLLRKLPLW